MTAVKPEVKPKDITQRQFRKPEIQNKRGFQNKSNPNPNCPV